MKRENYPYLTGLEADFKLLNKLVDEVVAAKKHERIDFIKRIKAEYCSSDGIAVIQRLWDRNLEWHENRDEDNSTILDEEILVAIANNGKEQYKAYADNVFGNQFNNIKLVVPERLNRFKQFYHESWREFLNYDEQKEKLNASQFVDMLQFILIATYQALEEQFAKSFEQYSPKLPFQFTKYDSDYVKPICLRYPNNEKVLNLLYTRLMHNACINLTFDEFSRHFREGERPERIIWFKKTKELVILFEGFHLANNNRLLSLMTTNLTIPTIYEHFCNRHGARIPMDTIKRTIGRGNFDELTTSKVITDLLKEISKV